MFNRIKKRIFLSLCLICLFNSLYGQENDTTGKRPTIAVVLGGGGAKGISEVALLHALEEEGIPVDMILGTSMGALIGSFYACGYNALEIRDILNEIDMVGTLNARNTETYDTSAELFDVYKKNFFSLDFTEKGFGAAPALVGDQKVLNILSKYTIKQNYVQDFDELPVRFRAVSTNAVTGKEIVFSKGSLLYAARASMSLPVIFTPTPTENGELAFDGCFSNNLPISVARELGADIVIAMDVASYSDVEAEDMMSISEIAIHAFNLMVNPKSIEQYHLADILINADVSEYGMMDYIRGKEIIDVGYREIAKYRSEIHELAVRLEAQGVPLTPVDYSKASIYSELEDPLIESVEVRDLSLRFDCQIPNPVELKSFVGKRLDRKTIGHLEKKLNELIVRYKLSSLSYEIRKGSEDGKYVLLLSANHYVQNANELYIGGKPGFVFCGNADGATNLIVNPEVTVGVNLNRSVPLEFQINLGDLNSLRVRYNPEFINKESVNWGFNTGLELKGGSLSPMDSIYYKERYVATDLGFNPFAEVKVFTSSYVSSIGLSYDFCYLEKDSQIYNLLWMYSGFIFDTLDNYIFGLDGIRFDAEVKAGIEIPIAIIYGSHIAGRFRHHIIEDISSIGFDFNAGVNHMPYKLKHNYGDYGGFDGMSGYGPGSFYQDYSLIGLQYQHRIFCVADIPFYATLRFTGGIRGDSNPYVGVPSNNSFIPFRMTDIENNYDFGGGIYFGAATPIGNVITGFSMNHRGKYCFMIGLM